MSVNIHQDKPCFYACITEFTRLNAGYLKAVIQSVFCLLLIIQRLKCSAVKKEFIIIQSNLCRSGFSVKLNRQVNLLPVP